MTDDQSGFLRVIDISDLAHPQEIGFCGTPRYAEDYLERVVVSGGYAYVAGSIRGLWVVDISDSTAPRVVGLCDYEVSGSALGVALSGDYLYVAASGGGMVVFSRPLHLPLRLVGQIGGVNNAVAVAGNRAYLGVGPRLVVLDISDPASPLVLGQTEPFEGVVEGIAVSGGYAYVTTRGGKCGWWISRIRFIQWK